MLAETNGCRGYGNGTMLLLQLLRNPRIAARGEHSARCCLRCFFAAGHWQEGAQLLHSLNVGRSEQCIDVGVYT